MFIQGFLNLNKIQENDGNFSEIFLTENFHEKVEPSIQEFTLRTCQLKTLETTKKLFFINISQIFLIVPITQ
jgi:hypothetical protein